MAGSCNAIEVELVPLTQAELRPPADPRTESTVVPVVTVQADVIEPGPLIFDVDAVAPALPPAPPPQAISEPKEVVPPVVPAPLVFAPPVAAAPIVITCEAPIWAGVKITSAYEPAAPFAATHTLPTAGDAHPPPPPPAPTILTR